MIDVKQLRERIITPALMRLGCYSNSGLELLTLTCAQESLGGTYIKQITGPALGIFQMEPETYNWLWETFLPRRSDLAYKVLCAVYLSHKPPVEFLEYNLLYSAMMCRIRYMTAKPEIPEETDVLALAHYWKDNYNRNPESDPNQAVAAYNKIMRIKKYK